MIWSGQRRRGEREGERRKEGVKGDAAGNRVRDAHGEKNRKNEKRQSKKI